MILTDRDLELFQFLNEQKYMTSGQIYRTFWPESKTRTGTARQRLTKLIDAGYVKTKDVKTSKNKRVRLFLITDQAISTLKEKKLDHGFCELTDINPLLVKHTLNLVDIRSVFREMGHPSWRCERLIRAEDIGRGWYPDGILEINGHKIAIELENSFRSKSVYIERFKHYRNNQDFALAIFIFSWLSVGDWLLDLDAPQNKVCFVHYDDLMKRKGNVWLYNTTSKIKLQSILK